MPAFLLPIIAVITNLWIFIFLGFYFFKVREKEKSLLEKENKVDTDYHHVVDDALARERKILEDATATADKIVTESKYVNDETKEAVNQALKEIVVEMQKEATSTAGNFMTNYSTTLKQLVDESAQDFTRTTQALKLDLEKQTKEFHDTMLPGLEKELEEYKKVRMQQVDDIVVKVIQKVAHEVLNKSISLEEHQELMVQSLEKAKKEGLFD